MLLSISFAFTVYADAFSVFKGVGTFSTVLVAVMVLGSGEQLTLREVACGSFTLVGIALIAQPPALFGHELAPPSPPLMTSGPAWQPRVGAGLWLAAISGGLSALSGSLMRLLSNASGPHQLSASMNLSFLMVVMVAFFGLVAAVGHATGLSEAPGWEWSALTWPASATDYALVAGHSASALAAWLATGNGYATTRAGMVAFLQLTELPWVYLLDVTVLDEPSSLLAGAGSALVFVSALGAARGSAKTASKVLT